ncbi:hypothetical protein [Runella rosea]|uniref:hypothetical protein n=1 Tax=Runella rosea TaxID=2259595 RepID=UPI0013B3F75A|nr:hypothetical protein [Runella rosea]
MERRRKYVVAAGECVIDPENQKAQAEKRAAFISLLRADKPPIFTPEHPKNVLVQHLKAFQNTLTILEENGCKNARELTAFELLTKMEFYQNRNEKTPDETQPT